MPRRRVPLTDGAGWRDDSLGGRDVLHWRGPERGAEMERAGRGLGRRTALLGAGALPWAVARAQGAWRIVTEYPAGALPGEGIAFFAQQAAAAGLTVVPSFDGPEGLRSATMLAAVSDGRVAAADAFTGAMGDVSPLFAVSSLPFLAGTAADARRLLAAARPAYEGLLAARGAVLLYATVWPATGLWSRQPVPDAAALRGLRVRTYDPAGTEVLRASGAVPEQISFADAVPRLQAGSLDAVLSSGDGGAGARLMTLLPHFTVLDYAAPVSLAFCAAAALEALPEAMRMAVREAGRATEARQAAALVSRDAENEARMRAGGVAIARAPALREAMVGVSGPVVAAWSAKAGPQADAILAAYRS